jgi:hypothetical protein
MRLVCSPDSSSFTGVDDVTELVLYGRADRQGRGEAGAGVKEKVLRAKLYAPARAWDLLSLALSVIAADLAGHRDASPDGWTREFDLQVSVTDPDFWNTQQGLIRGLLGDLTTDRWQISFQGGGIAPVPAGIPLRPDKDCATLLSGGLDSFVGALDLVAGGKRPFAVSQVDRGDADHQRTFAQAVGGGLRHLQLNHNTSIPDPERPPSQRARSLIFIAFGVLAATTLERYHAGESITLYVCENGFISVNPPLTGARLGSLSTRTTHPIVLKQLQQLLDLAGLRVHMENPYQPRTKGEMLRECVNQPLLRTYAAQTTSCARFKRYGFRHCGRCVPCLVRRAAFLASGVPDDTKYVYKDLGRDDKDYARFDDVRSVAMALAEVETDGLDAWIGTSLSTALLGDIGPLQAMVGRGLKELGMLFESLGVN